ncbi:TRAP transporter substrate-binding protein [Noviherbaspirillum galbum]|uniref:TRAP transporter substrate-binding protein n=1 Tax=Noviherbaspirillum galbum TaxID=2709383 RepID=A0A6B3SMR0_9BURK|nr:TRAP transporter substrate-binding protein [Noviherbaspirillum galbum]NEX62140.1 TRAP transporter substrate-binding protein [Noviherbaspirillum galbum]
MSTVIRCLVIRFAAAVVVALSGQAWALELKFATAYPANNFQTQNLQRYADDVAAATANRLTIRLHPGGSLLKPTDIFAGVRAGKAEGGEAIMSSLAREIPLLEIDSLPFIVSGYQDAMRMWETSRSAVEQALAARGLKLLYAVPWPPQNLYSSRPLKSVADFKGLRMRVYSPATERFSQLTGAVPVTIQVVDLQKAIADDQLDLMLTSSWTGVETQAWSRLKNYYRVNAWIPKNMVFMRQDTFERLDPETQKKMLDLAKVAEQRGWQASRESDQEYENKLSANGVSIQQLDPFMRRSLDRIGETLAREWLKKAGSEELKVLLRYTTERSMN